jgi:hypothetical protein
VRDGIVVLFVTVHRPAKTCRPPAGVGLDSGLYPFGRLRILDAEVALGILVEVTKHSFINVPIVSYAP